MSRQEVIEAVKGMCEDRADKFMASAEAWLDMALAEVINRKHYWWRRKFATFDTAAADNDYDLSADGLNVADDFLQFSGNIYRWLGNSQEPAEITWEGDPLEITKMHYSTLTGTPTKFTLKSGTTKTILLHPIPTAVEQIVFPYYAGVNIRWSSPPNDPIPLLPPEFHYVAYAALLKTAMFYLFGQKDPRHDRAALALERGLADLESYKAPSLAHRVSLGSTDQGDFVRATG